MNSLRMIINLVCLYVLNVFPDRKRRMFWVLYFWIIDWSDIWQIFIILQNMILFSEIISCQWWMFAQSWGGQKLKLHVRLCHFLLQIFVTSKMKCNQTQQIEALPEKGGFNSWCCLILSLSQSKLQNPVCAELMIRFVLVWRFKWSMAVLSLHDVGILFHAVFSVWHVLFRILATFLWKSKFLFLSFSLGRK